MLDHSISCYQAVSPLAFDFAYLERYHPQDGTLTLHWASQGFLDLIELTSAEIIKDKKGWRSLCHKEDATLVTPHIQNITNGKGSAAEFRVITKSGATIWLRDYAQSEKKVDHSTYVTILGAVKDLTDEKRNAFELQSGQADFIYRASHELRTPLTTAILTADLLKEGCDREEAAKYWEILDAELHRQKLLVDRLLTLGRIESGHIRYNYTSLESISIIKEAITSQKPLIDTKQIKIELEYPPDLFSIRADFDAVLQVIINLLNNAIKYSPSESTINLTLSNQDRDFSGMRRDGVCVEISDQGIGIPPEDLPLLFSKFFRASNAVQESIPGSGAGLYIVKSMLEEMGGNIQVVSKLNKGTTFKIWLPCR